MPRKRQNAHRERNTANQSPRAHGVAADAAPGERRPLCRRVREGLHMVATGFICRPYWPHGLGHGDLEQPPGGGDTTRVTRYLRQSANPRMARRSPALIKK